MLLSGVRDWRRVRTWISVLGLGASIQLAAGTLAAQTAKVEQNALSGVEEQLKAGLELSVTESGPFLPWRVQLTNTTNRHLRVGTDPRLLWFTANVPGQKKPTECKIPTDMRPASVGKRTVLLAPRGSYEFVVDPRFYCFEEGDQSVLVPGSQLVPHFGFPEATKTRWRRGKRVTIRQPQSAPFVAKLGAAPGPMPATSEGPKSPQGDDAPENSEAKVAPKDSGSLSPLSEEERTSGLKMAVGPAIALNTSYIEWARVRIKREEKDGPKLRLEVTRGSDSRTGSGARVTVKVSNRGSHTERLFIRREHLSFLLLGPDGILECPAADEERAPDAAAFTRLKPGQSTTLVTRLLEFCPTDYLNRPGFYLLAAELNVTDSGAAAGIRAFTGKLFTVRLRPLRIRSGELPFLHESLPSLREARRELRRRRKDSKTRNKPVATFRKRRKPNGAAPPESSPKKAPKVAPTPPPSATRKKH